MQAITTKYLSPTDTKGARVKAYCDAGSIIIDYPHELSGPDVHAKAAMALVRKLGWTPENTSKHAWYCGGIKHGYVFVYAVSDQYRASFGV